MKLFQYIEGNRKGREINRLEKKAMRDPFLADALDGFDKMNGNDHELKIKTMRTKVLHSTKSKKYPVSRYLSIAASILLIVGFGGYFLVNKKSMEENLSETKYDLCHAKEQMIEDRQPVSENAHQDDQQEMKLQFEIPSEKPLLAHSGANNQKEIKPAITVQEAHEEVNDEIQLESIVIQKNSVVIPDTAILIGNQALAEISNADGYFEVPESGEKKIRIDYTGYESVNLLADTNKLMMVIMKESDNALSEVVVVGYGSQKRSRRMDSTPSVKQESIDSEPVIGKKEYKKYLKKNVIMPQSEDCKGKKGRVTLKFAVNGQGRPVNIRVEKSLCLEADNEAIRLIREGSDWTLSDKDVEIEIKF
jgi:hypothetical protein